jgi:hypothetical protein
MELPRAACTAKLSLEGNMEYLLTTNNDGEMAEEKYYANEGNAADIIDDLQTRAPNAICAIWKAPYSVTMGLKIPDLRNMHFWRQKAFAAICAAAHI